MEESVACAAAPHLPLEKWSEITTVVDYFLWFVVQFFFSTCWKNRRRSQFPNSLFFFLLVAALLGRQNDVSLFRRLAVFRSCQALYVCHSLSLKNLVDSNGPNLIP